MNNTEQLAIDKIIIVAKDFSFTPGFRYKEQSKYSGEEFRETFLEPIFESDSHSIITINFDGTAGYPTSFLDEAFGGLVRKYVNKYGFEKISQKFRFISEEDKTIIEDVQKYMEDARTMQEE